MNIPSWLSTLPLALQLLLSIPVAIFVNILLGWAISTVNENFSKAKLITGILKGIAVYLAIAGLYLISLLVPEVTVEGFGSLNIMNSIIAILSAALAYYVYQDLSKLASVWKLKFTITDGKPIVTTVEIKVDPAETKVE